MNIATTACDYIRQLHPYVAGRPIAAIAREYGFAEADVIKLASNENPLGMPPIVTQWLQSGQYNCARYPDGDSIDLKQRLADKTGVAANQITIGNGSNELLDLIARAFLCTGRAAAFAKHSFAVYPIVTQLVGATVIETPVHEDFAIDIDALLRAAASAQVVYLATPNNPTGASLDADTLARLLAAMPSTTLFVLDEAYSEYTDDALYTDPAALLARYPNLVITKTFSKAYGMAGLRVGYALSSAAVADILNRTRQPFNVNLLAQHAALLALDDDAFIARSRLANAEQKAWLTTALTELGCAVPPSGGNFVMAQVGDGNAVFAALLRRGIIVRALAEYQLPSYVRITVGQPAENSRCIAALRDVLSA